jgi:hypothetical protein
MPGECTYGVTVPRKRQAADHRGFVHPEADFSPARQLADNYVGANDGLNPEVFAVGGKCGIAGRPWSAMTARMR